MSFSTYFILFLGLQNLLLSVSGQFGDVLPVTVAMMKSHSSASQTNSLYVPDLKDQSVFRRDSANCSVNSDCSNGRLCCEVFLDSAPGKTGQCYDPSATVCCGDGALINYNQLVNFTGSCCSYTSSDNNMIYCPHGYKCGDGSTCLAPCNQTSSCSSGDSCCAAPDNLSQLGSGSCYDSSKDICCFDGRVCNSSICQVSSSIGQCCAVNHLNNVWTYCGANHHCGFVNNSLHCLADATPAPSDSTSTSTGLQGSGEGSDLATTGSDDIVLINANSGASTSTTSDGSSGFANTSGSSSYCWRSLIMVLMVLPLLL